MPFFDNYAGHFNGGVIFLKPNLTHYQELVVHSQDDKYYNIDLAEQASWPPVLDRLITPHC